MGQREIWRVDMCMSHVTRYTSRVTRHMSHVTRHTSHVTRLVTRQYSGALGNGKLEDCDAPCWLDDAVLKKR
jgi:hypothetical protein